VPTITKFEDLEVWQIARVAVAEIYRATNAAPFTKDFGLSDQIRRAAVSIMANIAEGFAGSSRKEFIRFLGYSRGSVAEVKSHLYLAADLKYLGKADFERLLKQVTEVSKQLTGFIKYLKSDIAPLKKSTN
jgi:four helix bundle protein